MPRLAKRKRIATGSIVNLLASLADKSLVVFDESTCRYGLLETVRLSARERLASSDEPEPVRLRHLSFFLAQAEDSEPTLTGPKQAEWLERLEAEHDNIRAALEWCADSPDRASSSLRIAGSVWWFWSVRGHVIEGRRHLSRALAGAPVGDPAVRAKALNGEGGLAHCQADYAAARALFEEALDLRRELGDSRGIAGSLNNLGNLCCDQGDYTEARKHYEDSLAIQRETGDRRGIAYSIAAFAELANSCGHPSMMVMLLAAAEELRGCIGAPMPPNEQESRDRSLAAARTTLGEAAFAAALEAGRAMSMEQAVALALEQTDG